MWPSATVDSVMKQQEINLDFSRRQVMTIVNVTPDSFFAGSRTPDWLDVERRVREAVEAGASVIDVGGYSSRPGADEVSPEEEWRARRSGCRGRAVALARSAGFDRYVPFERGRAGDP